MVDIQLDKEGLKKRVALWIKEQKTVGINQKGLAAKWGVSYTYVNALSRERESVGFKVIKYLLDTDSKINARWLLFGAGEMYKEEEAPETILTKIRGDYIDEITNLRKQLKFTRGQNDYIKYIYEHSEAGKDMASILNEEKGDLGYSLKSPKDKLINEAQEAIMDQLRLVKEGKKKDQRIKQLERELKMEKVKGKKESHNSETN